MRRPLAETLLELAGALVPAAGGDPSLRITSLFIDVPIEIRLEKSGGDWHPRAGHGSLSRTAEVKHNA